MAERKSLNKAALAWRIEALCSLVEWRLREDIKFCEEVLRPGDRNNEKWETMLKLPGHPEWAITTYRVVRGDYNNATFEVLPCSTFHIQLMQGINQRKILGFVQEALAKANLWLG